MGTPWVIIPSAVLTARPDAGPMMHLTVGISVSSYPFSLMFCGTFQKAETIAIKVERVKYLISLQLQFY